jgi:hypothetical protein
MRNGTVTDRKNDGTTQLQTLQRWRATELEEARVEHAALERVVHEKEHAVDAAESDLADAQAFAREQLLDSAALSAESLVRTSQFVAFQSGKVHDAKTAMEESQTASDRARESVVRKLESLSVVERLQDRRRGQWVKDQARTDQDRLDEQALGRLAATIDQKITRNEEGE